MIILADRGSEPIFLLFSLADNEETKASSNKVVETIKGAACERQDSPSSNASSFS